MPLLIAFARILSQAAATLPVIALLTLLAGRRGNAGLCLFGARWLSGLALVLGASGPVWLIGSYLREVLPYGQGPQVLIAALLQPAGLPWSLSLLAWLAGWLAMFPALRGITFFAQGLSQNSYPATLIRGPIVACLLAAAFCFSPFILINWPFAGLPDSISMDRAFMAILRHANSEYFRGFAAAGAIALGLWPFWSSRLARDRMPVATRWLAFWALAGNLPWLLASLGPAIGASLNRAHMAAAYGINRQLMVLALFGCATLCWGVLLWKPRYLNALAWLALGLYVAACVTPALFF